MRSKRTTPEEQLRLITECRQSGLTDHEWCQQHGIKDATFYAWIHRLKQSGEIDIPAVIPRVMQRKTEQHDIVKIELEGDRKQIPDDPEESGSSALIPELAQKALQEQPSPYVGAGRPVMEVAINDIQLRVTNEVNPKLLAETILLLRGMKC